LIAHKLSARRERFILFVFVGAVLVGCGSSSSGSGGGASSVPVVRQTSAPTRVPAPTAGAAAGALTNKTAHPSASRPAHPAHPAGQGGTAAFIATMRKTFPGLTKGRTDQQLAAALRATCADATHPKVLTPARIAQRFGNNGSVPDTMTSTSIVMLALSTTCPRPS
jgi:hypothetical protein